MRMNISVPDHLAEQVRSRDLPISAICQRALRDAVDQALAIEQADDILVYIESEQADPDSATWPRFTPGTPTLTYKHWPVGKRTQLIWVLEYEESPGNPAGELFGGYGPGDPPIEAARQHIRSLREQGDMEEITVEVGEPRLTVGFTGRWLVQPDSDETRGGADGQDAGAYWGVALTKRGRIAVLAAHCNERWPASLNDYDSLDAAAADGLPADIAAMAAAELGETWILWRDI